MSLVSISGSYENDMREYTEGVLAKYGVSSKSAEREIICMAESGNAVAKNFYADLVYNQKILRKRPFRDAFYLYMDSAGIDVDFLGEWNSDGTAYPMAFWSVGYYLVNYKRGAALKICENIPEIDILTLEKRLAMALELAVACIDHEAVPGAINLVGRILQEASESDEMFSALGPVINKVLEGRTFTGISESIVHIESREKCAEISESFFVSAAQEGYVYACNSLAAREAERIVIAVNSGAKNEEVTENIINYICYLKIAADRLEPYAANRLGLFYINGEIKSGEKSAVFREYVDHSLAYEYFKKATIYPDSNSAWAYLNLMKYFHKDYDVDIDLMNEHMDYIKMLSKEVYDIAMDL